MSKIETFYEALNAETKKTKKYKIVEENKKFCVYKYEEGFICSSYETIKCYLESKQSAMQILRADAEKLLGHRVSVNIISN